jgi:predicted ATPase/DNA-binding SARP family transcriptional activator
MVGSMVVGRAADVAGTVPTGVPVKISSDFPEFLHIFGGGQVSQHVPGLKLWLLGSPRVEVGGSPVELQRRTTLALLAYLAATGEAHRRDSLATLLWPEADHSSARASLRRDLSALNKALGRTWLEIDGDRVQLLSDRDVPATQGEGYWLDTAQFQGLLAACGTHGHSLTTVCPACLQPLSEAVGLYRGQFLAGVTLRDSPEFDEWQFFQAETFRQDLAAALERLVMGFSTDEGGAGIQGISYARRWVALDPLHEPAHRSLMQLYARTGQQAAALRQYAACVRLLQEELHVTPEAETVRLYETIKAQRPPLAPVMTGAQLPSGLADLLPPPETPVSPTREEEEPGAVKPPLFVGHEHELAQLDHFLDMALANGGQVVFVVGEAGSGKTALVHEFARRAEERHERLIVAGGSCNAYTGLGDPYLPFREILGRLTGDLGGAWKAGAVSQPGSRRLQALMPQAIEALLTAGPDLIDSFIPGPSLVSRTEPFATGAAVWVAQLKELVARHAADTGLAKVKQTDFFEQYVRVVQLLSAQQPLLLVLDDLHWADAGSVGLLFHLGRRLRGSRILVAGIFRPAEVAPGRLPTAPQSEHPWSLQERERNTLQSLFHEFQLQFGDIVVDLGRAEGRLFVDAVLDSEPNRFGPEFRDALHGHTGGHALFTIEILRGMRERGDVIKNEEGFWVAGPALNWEILPARIEGVIGERIGRLPPMLREVLKAASVQGEVFTAEVVGGVLGIDERLMVRFLSRELGGRHRLIQNQSSRRLSPGGQSLSNYRFRHILFQKYLYNSLDEAERTYLHEAVGKELERLYDTQVEETSAQLAWHFEMAGWPARAVDYLHQAGNRAVRLSANEEALVHFSRGLKLLETLPASPELSRQELNLQIALFAPLAAARGYASPDLGKAYQRAYDLCRQVDDGPLLFQVLYGLWGHNLVRMKLNTARNLAQQCLAMAQNSQNHAHLLEANRIMGETAFHRGEVADAYAYLEKSRVLYDAGRHRAHAALYGQDPGVATLSHGCWALWHLGYPDQALGWSLKAQSLAREVAHPFSLAFAVEYASILHQARGEGHASREHAEAVMALAAEQKFAEWLPLATASRGWTLAERGEVEEGINQMRQGLATYRATGSLMFVSYFLILLARAHLQAGRTTEAGSALEEALATMELTEGRLWEAEIYRLQGAVALKIGGPDAAAAAEGLLLQALATARQRQARSLELRAATDLARVWHQHGKLAQATRLLEDVYGWFTEGFATADLQDAAAVLQRLRAGSEHGSP